MGFPFFVKGPRSPICPKDGCFALPREARGVSMSRKLYRVGDEPVSGYRLDDFLGRGGFGQVWKAIGPGGIEVALKIIDDLGRKKGGKELRALRLLKRIRHPNLVAIMAYWCHDADGNLIEDDGSDSLSDDLRDTKQPGDLLTQPEELIIAMALAEMSLFDRMEQCQKQGLPGIPVNELLGYMAESAKSIDYLNKSHSIQHCDIKPQNILIQSGSAQVCDFGLAKAIGDVRQTSMAAGTMAYGAPEIFDRRGPQASTDQYSLAVSFYELCTGYLPFHEESITAVLDAKKSGNLDFSRVSHAERVVLARATDRDPTSRYDNVAQMVRALVRCCPEDESAAQIVQGSPPAAPPLSESARVRQTMANAALAQTEVMEDQPLEESSMPEEARQTAAIRDHDTAEFGDAAKVGEDKFGEPATNPAGTLGTVLTLLVVGVFAAGVVASMWILSIGEGEVSDSGGAISQSSDSAPSIDRQHDALEIIAIRIQKAQENLDASPQETIDACNEAASRLDELGPMEALEDGVRKTVLQYRFDSALLRARAEARLDPPDWIRVGDDLTEVERWRLAGAQLTPSKIALIQTLAIVTDDNCPATETITAEVRLNALIATRDAFAASSDIQNSWTPSDDERDRLKNTLNMWSTILREDLRTATQDPQGILKNSGSFLKLWPNDAEVLTYRGDAHASLHEFSLAQDSFRQAREGATLEQNRQLEARLEVVDNILILREYDGSQATDVVAKAATSIDNILDEYAPAWPSRFVSGLLEEVATDLIVAAEVNRALLDDPQLKNVLAEFLKDQRLGTSADELRGRYDKMVNGVHATLTQQIVSQLQRSDRPDFQQLLLEIKKVNTGATQNPVLTIGHAECLLEIGYDQSNNAKNWQQARTLVRSVSKDSIVDSSYLAYVQALLDAEGANSLKWDDAADHLVRAFSKDAISIMLRAPSHRRKRAVEILVAGAGRKLQPRPRTALLKLLENPFSSEKSAQQTYDWLSTAHRLTKQPIPASTQMALAMAAWYKPSADKMLANSASTDVLEKVAIDEFTREQLPFLLVGCHAQMDDVTGRKMQVKAYSRILALASGEERETGTEVRPLDLYNHIIKPSIDAASGLVSNDQLDEQTKRQVASLYAMKGELLRKNRYETWPFDNRARETLTAYDTAVKLEPKDASYLAGRGNALLDTARVISADMLKQARRDAEAAIQANPKYPGGHGLMGVVWLREAENVPQLAHRPAVLEKAVGSLQDALRLSDAEDPQRADFLTQSSIAYTLWANYTIDPTREKIKELLVKARDSAQLATDYDSNYRDFAYRALGNSLEDLAWICKERENYDKAITAFTAAIDDQGDNPEPWRDRGRCYFKMVDEGGRDKGLLDKAEHDCNEALIRNPEFTEAFFWLGKIHYKKEEYEQADANLAKALGVDPGYLQASQLRVNIALSQARYEDADNLLSEAIEKAKNDSPQRQQFWAQWAKSLRPYPSQPGKPASSAMTARLPALRKATLFAAADDSAEAALFRGKVSELEAKWEDAIAEFGNGLTRDASSDDVKACLYLSRSGARYFSENADDDLRKGDESLILRDADNAAETAVTAYTEAEASFQAAQSRLKAATLLAGDSQEAKAKLLLAKTVENLETAIQLAPQHSLGSHWKHMLVVAWQRNDPTIYQRENDYNKAIQYLQEAYTTARTTKDRDSIGRLRQTLQRQRASFSN